MKMTIAEALAIAQADAKQKGYKLQGPNFAQHPETGHVRNLNQEAEQIAKGITGESAAPVVVKPAEGETLVDAAQKVVTEAAAKMNLPSYHAKPLPSWVWPTVGVLGVLGLVWFFKSNNQARVR